MGAGNTTGAVGVRERHRRARSEPRAPDASLSADDLRVEHAIDRTYAEVGPAGLMVVMAMHCLVNLSRTVDNG
jgi:hypothetical protein